MGYIHSHAQENTVGRDAQMETINEGKHGHFACVILYVLIKNRPNRLFNIFFKNNFLTLITIINGKRKNIFFQRSEMKDDDVRN